MPAVEAVGHAQQSAHPPDGRLVVLVEPGKLVVLACRSALAVVARDQRDECPVVRVESQPVGVGDQLVAVLVVIAVRHQLADVVQQRRRLEQPRVFDVAAECRGELFVRARWRGSRTCSTWRRSPRQRSTNSRISCSGSRGPARLRSPTISSSSPSRSPYALAVSDRASRASQQLGGDCDAGEDDVGALRIESRHAWRAVRATWRRATRAATPLRRCRSWCRGSRRRGCRRGAAAIRARLVNEPPEPITHRLAPVAPRQRLLEACAGCACAAPRLPCGCCARR